MSSVTKTKLVLISGILLLTVGLLYSDSALPSSVEFYSLKRLQEKIFMIAKNNPRDKVNYYSLLLDKRLQEIQAVIENRDFNLILSSSLRYSTTAGLMTNLIVTGNLSDLYVPTVEKFKKHQIIFKSLDDNYPKDEGQEWKFIQDDYNYLSIYLQQLVDQFGNENTLK